MPPGAVQRSWFRSQPLFYKGPARWYVLTTWFLCAPSILSLILALAIDAIAQLMLLLHTTAGAPGRLLYFLTVAIWFLAILCAALATLGTLSFLILKVPAKTIWSVSYGVLASWLAIGAAYVLFLHM